MDPLTAFFSAVEAGFKLVSTVIEGQPPDVKAELWKLYLQDVKAFRAFFEQFHQKEK
jgi:hypothetical protein